MKTTPMSEEKKNKIISSGVSILSMTILFIVLALMGLRSEVPPPQAKKAVLIELSSGGGGGGGGGNEVASASPYQSRVSSAENFATQNHTDVPVTSRQDRNTTRQDNTPQVQAPVANPNAAYRPGRGGGTGGGTGTGTGTGTGSGIGPGEGSGTGGGIGSGTGTGTGSGVGVGYGTGNRGYRYMPDLTTTETGQVCVEVHVNAAGNVVEARIIYNLTVGGRKYTTTITNADVQNACVAKAKTAKYNPGKEELRIIVFK